MSDQAPCAPDEAPALVVFGLDETGKAHASTFIENEVELATKAAALMGMRLMPVHTDGERALAAKLPRGRIFASGKGFVPFVKAGLYAELEAAAPADTQVPTLPSRKADIVDDGEELDDTALLTSQTAISSHLPEAVPQPSDWADIQVGSIVLAAAPTDEGWYECVVLSGEGDDLFKLRYCDFPKEPPFQAHRVSLGLMHPSHMPEPPVEAAVAAPAA